MGNLYLHIGTPKTGTSAIQVFLGKNRSVLKKKGYCYPDFNISFTGIGKNRNAHFLIHRYYDENKERDYEKEKEIQENAFAILLKELERYDNVILSDEGIWNNFEYFDNFWEKFHSRITAAGHTLQVIVYVRRQDSFVQSYWAQQVKETCVVSFQQYMGEERYKKCHLDYDVALDRIAGVVGSENIIVRVYEKAQYYQGSLVADFLHVVGLEMNEEYKTSKDVVNGSITGKSLEIKRILNEMPQFRKKGNWLVEYLLKLSRREKEDNGFARAACFLPGQQKEFLAQYAEGNEKVARKYLNRENGILFEEEVVNQEGIIEEYSKEELVLACGKMLSIMHKQLLAERKKKNFVKKTLKKVKNFRCKRG